MTNIKRTVCVFMMLSLVLLFTGCNSSDYKKATALYDQGEYAQAQEIFEKLGDYEDSADKVTACAYQLALSQMESGDYEGAKAAFEALGDYEESKSKAEVCTFEIAGALAKSGDLDKALATYQTIPNYNGVSDLIAGLEHDIMLRDFAPVFEGLEGHVWYYESGSVNAVNTISFADGVATLGGGYVDGNGSHVTTLGSSAPFTVSETEITVSAQTGEIKIPYTLEGATVKLDESYVPEETILSMLQGFWSLRSITYNPLTGYSSQEYHIQIDGDKISYEYAVPVYGRKDGSYYYYGPYSDTFTLDSGTFISNIRNGSAFFVRLDGGDVSLFHYSYKLERSTETAFPGQDGYKF